MEAITEAFAVHGYAVQTSPNFLAVFDAKAAPDGEPVLIATVASAVTNGLPPVGEHDAGQYYLATRHRDEPGTQVKYRPGDNVDDFARRVLRLPPLDRSAH